MSGLQARFSQHDPRLYNPSRDVAHNFPYAMRAVADTLEKRAGPFNEELMRAYNVTEAQLGDALKALVTFMYEATTRPDETMGDGLEHAGWFALPPAAQQLVLAALGRVLLGLHWAGVREATLGGNGPILTYGDLQARGLECATLMARPRWQRKLYKLLTPLRRAWRALRGQA